MDSKFLIEQGSNDIAGFQQLFDGKRKEVWCAECAVDDGESLPYIADETELDLPDFESIEGSIGPIMYRMFDQYAELEGDDPEVTKDLSSVTCDSCGQSLHPE